MIPAAGFILVDKPAGVTSFDVVNRVRGSLVEAFPELAPPRRRGRGPKPPRFKCGHAGTLDPLATGLLVVLVGKGSRLSPFLLGLDKTYLATVRFGSATDSLDADGEVTATAPPPDSPDVIAHALPRFRGAIDQVPPLISALKRDGQALHKRVRAGEDVAEPEARPVTIHRLVMDAARWEGDVPEVDLTVACSSGTYIRSLARDLAEAAGSVAHIAALRRTEVGPFAVDDAVVGVMEMPGEDLIASLRPAADALPWAPAMELSVDEADFLRSGGQPGDDWLDRLKEKPVTQGKSSAIFRMLDTDGGLVAVGRIDESGLPRTALVMAGKG